MTRQSPRSTLFPYTTLFRSAKSCVLLAKAPPQEARAVGILPGAHAPPARPLHLEHPEYAHSTRDRKSTRLNSSHVSISYAVFCLKKKKHIIFPPEILEFDGL